MDHSQAMDGKSVTAKVVLNSGLLALINIVSIIAAYGFYYLLRPANQVAFQAPVAGFLSITAFCFWTLVVKRFKERSSLPGWGELIAIHLVAMLWIPMLFVPLHYVTQGYLSSLGNITAILFFQIPTNLVALILANKIVAKKDQLWRPVDPNRSNT
jgi:hypothetical protein